MIINHHNYEFKPRKQNSLRIIKKLRNEYRRFVMACISEKTFLDYYQNNLSKVEKRKINKHLKVCDACRMWFDLTPDLIKENEAQEFEPVSDAFAKSFINKIKPMILDDHDITESLDFKERSIIEKLSTEKQKASQFMDEIKLIMHKWIRDYTQTSNFYAAYQTVPIRSSTPCEKKHFSYYDLENDSLKNNNTHIRLIKTDNNEYHIFASLIDSNKKNSNIEIEIRQNGRIIKSVIINKEEPTYLTQLNFDIYQLQVKDISLSFKIKEDGVFHEQTL